MDGMNGRPPEAILIVDRDGRCFEANDAACTLLGYARAELLRKRFGDLLAPEQPEQPPWSDDFPGWASTTEQRLRRRDGRDVIVETTTKVLGDGRLQVTGREIGAHELAEEETALRQAITLAANETEDLEPTLLALLAKVASATGWPVGRAWIVRPDDRMLECSATWGAPALALPAGDAAPRVLAFGRGLPGRACAAAQAMSIAAPAADAEAFPPGLRAAFAVPVLSRERVVAVLEFFAYDRRPRDARALRAVESVAAGLGPMLERKRAHEVLRVNEQQYRLFFERSPQPMWVIDPDTFAFLAANDAAIRHYGYSRDEFLSMTIADIRPLEEIPRLRECVATFNRQRHGYAGLWKHRKKDGTIITVEIAWNRVVLRGRDAILALSTDVTERVRAETAQAERAGLLRAIIETHPECVALIASDGTVLDLNPAGLAVLEVDALEQAFGRSIFPFVLPPYRPALTTLIENVFRGQNGRLEFEAVGLKQTRRWLETHAVPLRNPNGQILALLAVTRDVTERKRAENERAQAFAQEHEYASQLRGLTEAAVAINSGLSVSGILRVLTEKARAIIGAHQCVTNLTTGGDWAQALSAVSLSDKYAKWRRDDAAPDSSGIYARVCRAGRALRRTQAELEADSDWRGFGAAGADRPPLRGWLAAPLTLRDGRSAGLIQLSDKHEGEFTEKDEAILVQLAQMAAVAIDNAQLYAEVEDKRVRLAELSSGLLKTQEEELKAVSRELHDNVSQILTAVKMNLDLLRSDTIWPPSFRTRIEESIEMIKGALHETRDLAQSIRPPVLDELGLVPAVRWHLDDFQRRSGIQVEFETSGAEPLPHPEISATIYRVIQEAMTNIARHSGAQRAKVVLQFEDNMITGSIDDNGKGFHSQTLLRSGTRGGLGLLGMRERIELAGGEIRIESRPGYGARIAFSVPNRRSSDALEENPHPSGR